MALIKTGSLVTELNGKIGGQSFQRSREGLTLQNAPGHLHRSSVRAQNRRSYEKRLYQTWRSLTAAQRNAWESAANVHTYTDILGNSYKLTGFMTYVNANSFTQQLGIALIATPINQAATTSLTTLSIAIVSLTSIIATFVTTPTGANQYLLIFASPILSPGHQSPGKKMQLVYLSNSNGSSPVNFTTQYVSVYGSIPKTGDKVFFKGFIYSGLSGMRSASLIRTVIV